MSAPRLAGLRSVLDRRNWHHLEEYWPDVAAEIESAILEEGSTPEEIGREMLSTIGEHRRPFITNCVSAARWVAGTK